MIKSVELTEEELQFIRRQTLDMLNIQRTSIQDEEVLKVIQELIKDSKYIKSLDK